jgi:hypothetical protein
MPALTSSPSSSTGTGINRAPASVSTSRAPGYPGSSTQTGLRGSSSTRAAMWRACCEPLTTITCAASQWTPRAVRR